MNREPEILDVYGQRTSEVILDWLHRTLGRDYYVIFGEPPDEDHSALIVENDGRTIEVAVSNEIVRRPTVDRLSAIAAHIQKAFAATE